jgi:hypothetical protein
MDHILQFAQVPGKTGAKEFSGRKLLPMSGEHNHNGTGPSRLGETNLCKAVNQGSQEAHPY